MSTVDLLHTETIWKQITKRGNTLMESETINAVHDYETALQKAEALMEHHIKCLKLKIPVRPIFIISCNNLAEAYCHLKNWNKADTFLKRSIYYIEYLMSQPTDLSVKLIYSKQLMKQMLLYKSFSEQSNQPEKYNTLHNYLKGNISDYSLLED
ncbi:hypothetical protein [Lacinutrix jangbogonensis]|uniref:hypothetical protein n=1 Tax=Lacinutrix jangbogonensis TaxID=1469557 RepID=UPI00053E9D89|nr:hypothetical protein [Lacinutrix jangbogonensis]